MTEFNREELLGTLDQLRPALATGGLLPELTHLWFDTKNVFAYDGELGIKRRLASDINFALPGKMLLDLLKTSALEKVTIGQIKADGMGLKLGRAKIDLAYIEPERKVWPFPFVPPKEEGLKLTEELFSALETLSIVKQTSPQNPLHFGVLVIVEHEQIKLYATDDRTAAAMVVKARSVSMPKFMLPWKMITAMRNLLAKNDKARLWVRDDCVVAGAPGTLIATNWIDLRGTQDVVKIMEQRFGGKMQSIPKGFKLLLERAAILAAKDEPLVRMVVSKGELRITGKFAQGQIDETLEVASGTASVSTRQRANAISRVLGLCDRFALSERTIALSGANGFKYVVSAKEMAHGDKEGSAGGSTKRRRVSGKGKG